MCINPSYVWVQLGPKWEKEPVPCRQCWRCRKNRLYDYIGRALCEAATSKVVCTITLTYAPRSDLADKVIYIRHFQLFMKLLRKAGHKVRYLCAGEYGSLRGRSHFHAILFFTDLKPAPDGLPAPFYNPDHLHDPSSSSPFSAHIPQKQMCHIREWPHGHVSVDWAFDERSAYYVTKYLLKEDKHNAWFSLSKKPALGSAWFAEKARQARELGVLPSKFEYQPPGARRDVPFLMTGATRRDYLNAITIDPALKPRMSEWVLKTFEKHERQRLIDFLENQPADVLASAFDEHRDCRAEQFELRQLFARMRDVARCDDLLAESEDGILRRYRGRWLPQADIDKEKANGSSS